MMMTIYIIAGALMVPLSILGLATLIFLSDELSISTWFSTFSMMSLGGFSGFLIYCYRLVEDEEGERDE